MTEFYPDPYCERMKEVTTACFQVSSTLIKKFRNHFESILRRARKLNIIFSKNRFKVSGVLLFPFMTGLETFHICIVGCS